MKYLKIIIGMSLISSMVLSAQETKSEIIISEEKLISLIQKIKERKEKLKIDNVNNYNNYRAVELQQSNLSNRSYSVEKTQIDKDYSADLNDIKYKLVALEYEMKYLNTLLLNNQKRTDKEDILIINTPAKKDKEIKKDDNLEKKIDSLRSLYLSKNVKENKTPDINKEELKALNDKYQSLLNKVSNNINSKDTLVIEKRENSDYSKLVSQYGKFKKQVYFDNNSKTLLESNHNSLNDIIKIVNSSEKIDVYLKGFASKKGNPLYNENLSLQRTESIKKHLILKGIHPSRILTQYHGIDYLATSEDSARRVDLTFIIRK